MKSQHTIRRRETGKASFWRVVWSAPFWVGLAGVGFLTAFLTREMARNDEITRDVIRMHTETNTVGAIRAEVEATHRPRYGQGAPTPLPHR